VTDDGDGDGDDEDVQFPNDLDDGSPSSSEIDEDEALFGSRDLRDLMTVTGRQKIDSFKMFLTINILSHPCSALVDTGATRSFLDEQVRRTLDIPVRSSTSLDLLTVSGVTASVGVCDVTFSIGDQLFSHPFHVLPLPRMEAILGVDFLAQHAASICAAPPRLSIRDHSFHLHDKRACMSCTVYVTHSSLLPPNLSMVMHLSPMYDFPSAIGLFEPSENFRHLFRDAVVDTSSNCFRVLATSFSADEQLVPVGTDVGLIVEVPDELAFHALSFPSGSPSDRKSAEVGSSCPSSDLSTHSSLCSSPAYLLAIRAPLAERATTSVANLAPELKELVQNADVSSSAGRKKLRAMLIQYTRIFSPPSPLGHVQDVKHRIELKEPGRVHSEPPRRLSPHGRQLVREKLQEMKELGVIRRSSSPFASGVVLVPKPDGSVRFCIDYRNLNSNTTPNAYPLPRIDDLLGAVREARIFSKFDLRSGYWQVDVDRNDVVKTAFTTHEGLYECLRMPFGLCNAPATFQAAMNRILAGLLWNCCLVYLDDVLVFSRTEAEHFVHLQQIFDLFLQSGPITLKPSKCQLFAQRLTFLGHEISIAGISPMTNRVKAIVDMPAPKDLAALRSFLGMVSYYRVFIRDCATAAAPLYRLCKKDVPYSWDSPQQKAFTRLKRLLSSTPILARPAQKGTFVVATDASDVGLGAVLSQRQPTSDQERVIEFASRSLTTAESKWQVGEREALAILWAVRRWRPFLVFAPFVIQTDHKNLNWIFHKRQDAKITRWALELSEYNFALEYRPGKQNANADALSRLPLEDSAARDVISYVPNTCLTSSTVPETVLSNPSGDDWLDAQRTDTFCQDVRRRLAEKAEETSDLFRLNADHLLVFHPKPRQGLGRLVVPLSLRETILQLSHGSLFGGHFGAERTLRRIATSYYWPGLRRDVIRFVRGCLTCKKVKSSYRPRIGLHQKYDLSAKFPFHIISIDLVGPLTPPVGGYTHLLTAIDWATRWPEAIPIKSTTAETVVDALVNQVFSRHSFPEKLISDNGPQFRSELMARIGRCCGVQHIFVTPFHPESNGRIERFHRTLKTAIRSFLSTSDNWLAYLPFALFAIRTAYVEDINNTPFFLLYGRDPVMPTDWQLLSSEPYKSRSFSERVAVMGRALEESRRRANRRADKRRSLWNARQIDVDHEVGSLVLVYTPIVKPGHSAKFAVRWRGPFRVTQKISHVDYEVRDLADGSKQKVHVRRLLQYEPWMPYNRVEALSEDPSVPSDDAKTSPSPEEPVSSPSAIPSPPSAARSSSASCSSPASTSSSDVSSPSSASTSSSDVPSSVDVSSPAVAPSRSATHRYSLRNVPSRNQRPHEVPPPRPSVDLTRPDSKSSSRPRSSPKRLSRGLSVPPSSGSSSPSPESPVARATRSHPGSSPSSATSIAPSVTSSPSEPFRSGQDGWWNIERIVERRKASKKRDAPYLYLVKWDGYAKPTWQPRDNIEMSSVFQDYVKCRDFSE